MSEGTRALTRAALSAAAGVAALYLGSLLPSARLSILCVATLGVVFVKMSCPGRWALGCYAVTAALGLLLLPDKSLAVLYAAFMGYYPLVRLRAERFSNPAARWGLKLGAFFAAALALYLLAGSVSFLSAAVAGTALWALWAAGIAVFLVYDFALGQLILYYLRNIAGRIK